MEVCWGGGLRGSEMAPLSRMASLGPEFATQLLRSPTGPRALPVGSAHR